MIMPVIRTSVLLLKRLHLGPTRLLGRGVSYNALTGHYPTSQFIDLLLMQK